MYIDRHALEIVNMKWRALGKHLKENWRPFIASAAAGASVALTIVPWVLGQSWIRSFLSLEDWLPLTGIVMAVLLCTVLLWPKTVDFLRRYQRTVSMASPPLLYVDLVGVGIMSVGIIVYLFRHRLFAEVPISGAVTIFFMGLGSILIMFLVSSLIWARRKRISRFNISPRDLTSGDYIDEPITHDSQDLLGRVEFAERLYKQIVSLPFPDSFVFGLSGSWGEGKTSILNLMLLRLEDKPSVIPIAFNPWYFATEAALIESFYAKIEEVLRQRYLLSSLRHVLRRYRSLLTLGLWSLGFRLETQSRDDPQALRRQLEQWIARMDCKLVIFIDEIDRLQPSEVIAVFKLARLSASLQNTVFLLSFDEVVTRTMLNRSNVDPAFLEKVIQKSVSLPPAEQKDIDRFLLYSEGGHRSAIDCLLDEIGVVEKSREQFNQRFVTFYRTHLRPLFRTIRRAKRYLNGLRASLPPIAKEVNLCDFFLLELIRTFWPSVFQDICRCPWFYLPPWGLDAMVGTPFSIIGDENVKHDQIRNHIEAMLESESQKEILREILEEIFFVEVRNALNPRRRMNHDNASREYRAEKRLTHPECFPKYLLSRVPAGELADKVVEDLIAQWNECTISEAEALVGESLGRYREGGQLIQVLEKLAVFARLVDLSRVPAIVRALYRAAPNLSRVIGSPWVGEYDMAENLLLNLIDEHVPADQIHRLLEEVVRETPSLHFAVSIVASCHSRGYGRRFEIYQAVDIAGLRRVGADRLHSYFVVGNRDIFAELTEDEWGYIIYQWGTNWDTRGDENRLVVQSYIMSLFDDKPENLGRVLSRFVNKSSSPNVFMLDEFRQIYDPDEIAERLHRYGDRALPTAEARRASELFEHRYRRYRDQTINGGDSVAMGTVPNGEEGTGRAPES